MQAQLVLENSIGGMSDLHKYELEDIAWDELDQIGDHLVPHPSNEHENEPAYQEDNYKKHQHEVIQPQKKTKTKSLEKDSWSHATSVIPGSCDSGSSREATVLSDSIRVPENDLSFLDNDRKNNESADLLYYEWPDIGNFADVDTMLRSYDSTFGFGGSNQDDMAWLSSDIESNFVPFQSVPEQDLSKPNNVNDDMVNDSNVGSSSISYKSGFQGSESGEAHPLGDKNTKYQQGVQLNTAINFNNSTANHLTDEHVQRKKQAKRPNISEAKRKDRCKTRQVLAHSDDQKQKKDVAPNSFGYLQTPTPYIHSNYVYSPNQISADSQVSGLKSEMNSLTSASPRESSYSHPFSGPEMSVDEKLENFRTRQGFYHYSVSEQFNQSPNEVENHNGVERNNVTNPADRDSSSVPETSCTSSGFDKISLEASSFRQLKQVVEQLDIKTKSCIRDSLYRLARSAEQKHKYANMKGSGLRDREAGDPFMADGSNNGLTDMETDTNPIDRSVAHLLFHRPSDSSTMPAHVDSSLKSHTMLGELVRKEEAASDAS